MFVFLQVRLVVVLIEFLFVVAAHRSKAVRVDRFGELDAALGETGQVDLVHHHLAARFLGLSFDLVGFDDRSFDFFPRSLVHRRAQNRICRPAPIMNGTMRNLFFASKFGMKTERKSRKFYF